MSSLALIAFGLIACSSGSASPPVECSVPLMAEELPSSHPVIVAVYLRNATDKELILPEPSLGESVFVEITDQGSDMPLPLLGMGSGCGAPTPLGVRISPHQGLTTFFPLAIHFALEADVDHAVTVRYVSASQTVLLRTPEDYAVAKTSWIGQAEAPPFRITLTETDTDDRAARVLSLDASGLFRPHEGLDTLLQDHATSAGARYIMGRMLYARPDGGAALLAYSEQEPDETIRAWLDSALLDVAGRRCDHDLVRAVRGRMQEEEPWARALLRGFETRCAGSSGH